MAREGFSYNPDDEAKKPDTDTSAEVPKKIGFSDWLDNLRIERDAKEHEKDEEEEDSVEFGPAKPKSRKLFEIFFPSLVSKEDVKNKVETPSDSVVTETTPIFTGAETPRTVETEADNAETEDQEELLTVTQSKVKIEAEPTREPESVSSAEAAAVEAPQDVIPTAVSAAEAIPEPSPAPAESIYFVDRRRGLTPEAVLFGAYEHHRITKLKKREKKLEHKVEGINKNLKKTSETVRDLKYDAANRVPAESVVASFRQEVGREKEAERRTIVQETKKEIIAETANLTTEKAPEKKKTTEVVAPVMEQYSEKQKEQIIERILTEPKNTETLTDQEHKDISYELSHEHKDLDKQSAAAWAQLQATADANAKANAQALASASSKIPLLLTKDDPALVVPPTTVSKTASSIYKKAALSGFITAVVLLAIYIVINLLQSK